MIELPAQQRTLYDTLAGKGDVPISTIHAALNLAPAEDRRQQQQALGPYIIRLNRRLVKKRQAVKPGALKGTYALVTI